jgi:hypothetical protein
VCTKQAHEVVSERALQEGAPVRARIAQAHLPFPTLTVLTNLRTSRWVSRWCVLFDGGELRSFNSRDDVPLEPGKLLGRICACSMAQITRWHGAPYLHSFQALVQRRSGRPEVLHLAATSGEPHVFYTANRNTHIHATTQTSWTTVCTQTLYAALVHRS